MYDELLFVLIQSMYHSSNLHYLSCCCVVVVSSELIFLIQSYQ